MIDPISIGLWFLAGATVGVAVAVFWQEIREFFIASFKKLPTEIQRDLQGVVALARAIDNIMMTTFKYYSYNQMTQSWNETINTRNINANDVPEHIKMRAQANQGQDIDITQDVAKELQLKL